MVVLLQQPEQQTVMRAGRCVSPCKNRWEENMPSGQRMISTDKQGKREMVGRNDALLITLTQVIIKVPSSKLSKQAAHTFQFCLPKVPWHF